MDSIWKLLFTQILLRSTVYCKFSNTAKFLKNLENSLDVNYVNIINIGNNNFIDGIIQSLKMPKVAINLQKEINYLNLPRYCRRDLDICLNTLKYYFNYKFLTIVFADEFQIKLLRKIDNLLLHSINQVLVLISGKSNNSESVFNYFNNFHYSNVIFINVQSFENS